MKKILLATVAVAAFGAQAWAADLPSTKGPPPPPVVVAPAPVVNWTGVYTGDHIGVIWANADFSSPGFPSVSVDPVMGFFGGQYGYNYQMGPYVFGVLGDYDYTNANGANGIYKLSERWLASANGRIGYAMGDWLPYVIGGVAFSEVRNQIGKAKYSKNVTGFDVGAGLEYYISDSWSAFAEYRYYDFGSVSWPGVVGALAIPGHSVSKTDDTFRVGLSYHYGPHPFALLGQIF